MRFRFNLNIEVGPPDPDPPEQSGADALTERADQSRPIGFYPPSDPTRRTSEDE